MLADTLVVAEGRGGESVFWTLEARALLTGLILHVATTGKGESRTLAKVRAYLTSPPKEFEAVLEALRGEHPDLWAIRVMQRRLGQCDGEVPSV